MLTVHQISKSFGVRPLLKDITFVVNDGERIGLIGPNGCGKSTLLRIIAGIESSDDGHIAINPDARLGYLAQGFTADPELTLQQVLAQAAGDATQIEKKIQQLAGALSNTPDNSALQDAYDHALQRLSKLDPGRRQLVLEALGIDNVSLSQPVGSLSGGQKTRLSLAVLLLDDPDLLLLDEPTNHLDIAMLEWLEQWLHTFDGAVLLVSHDRAFLNRTVDKIVAIDPLTQRTREYPGTYDDYMDHVQREYERQMDAFRDQRAEIRRMRQDIARIKQQAQATERSTKNDQQRRYAKKVARKAKSREKRLERYLNDPQRVQKPERSWQMKLAFDEPEHVGQDALVLNNVAVGYDTTRPLLKDLDLVIQGGQRVVLVGPNGCGKTTLLRTIAGQIPSLHGELRTGSGVRLGYMSQERKLLDRRYSALQMMRRTAPMNETEARSFLHFFLFSGDDSLRPGADLSFGQRARLALALLVARGCNFLLLDEPLNHLDIPSRSRFEEALAGFDGTVLAVVHDRTFIKTFATELWEVRGDQIERVLR